MKSVRILILAMLAMIVALSSQAVTDKEMEEARTITAKAYLRWVNNGSDYLDKLSVRTMTELNSKLKSKEKENIKAFNSVNVPSDYASWDKQQLVEYWSSTFFKSPELDSQGKGARVRVRKQISEMNVSDPVKTEETAPAEEQAPSETSADAQAAPTAENAVDAQQDILNDQKAIEKAAEEAEAQPQEEQSHTWLYVVVLAILVAVVIWLVVYAANLMKRQSAEEKETRNEDDGHSELRAQARKAITAKNDEIDELRNRLRAEENKNAELGMEIEKLKLECSRYETKLAQLREENKRLQNDTPSPAREERPVTRTVITPRAERRAEEPVKEQPVRKAAPEPAAPILKVIYLGRANKRGIFVRADRRINAGNTIFRLDTNDGLVGTFHVVDEPEVVDVALSAPDEYLANGCTGEDLEDTAGVTRIATESAGTAIFENGYWKVLRKTRIRYE